MIIDFVRLIMAIGFLGALSKENLHKGLSFRQSRNGIALTESNPFTTKFVRILAFAGMTSL